MTIKPSPSGAAPQAASLRKRLVRASVWLLAGHGLSQLIRLASSLILTRLLAPDMYGVMSVGYMVVTALWMLSDIGLAAIAVQSRRGEDPNFLDAVWLLQIARGGVIFLGCLALAALAQHGAGRIFPADSVYADPRIPTLIAIVSVYGLVSSFESTKVYLARRLLSMKRLTAIDLASQLFSTVFIIVWAALSPSVWALAVGWVAGAVVKVFLTHAAMPGPANRLRWDPAAWPEIYNFGKWTVLSSTLSFMLANADRLLLGIYLDAPSMGHYSIALVIVGAAQSALSKVIGNAMLPALSEVARDRPEQLRKTLYQLRRPLDWVCLGGAGALVFLGEPIVRLLYDARYAAAGGMLGIVGLLLAASRLESFDQCAIAMGRAKLLSMVNIFRMIVLYTAIPFGFSVAGTTGALYGIVLASVINSIIVLAMQWRMGIFDGRREVAALPIFAGGVAVGWLLAAIYWAIRHWLGR